MRPVDRTLFACVQVIHRLTPISLVATAAPRLTGRLGACHGTVAARGHKVFAVQLPEATLDDQAVMVQRAIAAQDGPVLLVGHLDGRAVNTHAGGVPKLAGLVHVDALAPGEGESINDPVRPFPPARWLSELILHTTGYLRRNDAAFLASFARDFPKPEAPVLATAQGPIYYYVLGEKARVPAWRTRRSWWVYCTADMVVPKQQWQAEAARIGAHIRKFEGPPPWL